MSVVLSREEVRALKQALDNYLPELRYSTARIKVEADRHELVHMERVLNELRRRLDEQGESAELPMV